jgi:CheY-like chemotaxis protein
MNFAKVLIVEDEFVVADDIEARLLDLGYAVAGKANSGAEAIEFAESHSPDLVLMDIHLRGPMDGITAATEIRQRFKLPVVFLRPTRMTARWNGPKRRSRSDTSSSLSRTANYARTSRSPSTSTKLNRKSAA